MAPLDEILAEQAFGDDGERFPALLYAKLAKRAVHVLGDMDQHWLLAGMAAARGWRCRCRHVGRMPRSARRYRPLRLGSRVGRGSRYHLLEFVIEDAGKRGKLLCPYAASLTGLVVKPLSRLASLWAARSSAAALLSGSVSAAVRPSGVAL